MLAQILAPYLELNPRVVDNLLRKSGRGIQADPMYQDLVASLDRDALNSSMVDTRLYMDRQLPPFVQKVKKEQHIEEFPLDGFMVSNWIIGYLHTPQRLPDLLNKHRQVPKDVMQYVLPHVLEMLGGTPKYSAEWQKAFATIAIPLVVEQY